MDCGRADVAHVSPCTYVTAVLTRVDTFDQPRAPVSVAKINKLLVLLCVMCELFHSHRKYPND